jgi:hypothetical protein
MRIAITAGGRVGCAAVVGFRNSLAQQPDPDRTLTLTAGHTGFADLSLTRFASRFGQRVEMRPFVQVTAGQCDGSVEVFEVFTGRTTASLRLFTGLTQPPDPDTPGLQNPPDPDFPVIGAVRGQMVRLGVARTKNPPATPGLASPPEPDCQAVLGFADDNGNALGPQKRIVLAPGQFDFLDLDPSQVPPGPSTAGGRVSVRPVLLAAGGSMAGCQASAQVFEQFTGWTSVVMQGR